MYLIAHDIGTSGNKATLFSEDGKLITSVTHAYNTHYFNETWVEQDAHDWWNAVCITTRSLIADAQIDPTEIAAVSFSGQMMGALCVDKSGNPLRPSIIWADQRATAQSDQIAKQITQRDFYHIVGHRNTPSYGLQKLMWIRDNEPDIYAKTYKVLNAKDFIVLKLTNQFYTEPSDANSMACFDLNTWEWSDKILAAAKISKDKFPEIKPSTFVAGGVTKDAAIATGLAEGTKVVMGGGDGVVANIGCGSIAPGKTYCCLGTSAWITTTTQKPVFDPKMRTVTWAHIVPGLYAPNGTMQYAGGSYSWLKNTICTLESHQAEHNNSSPFIYMNEQIEQSSIGSNGVMFLPYMLGERAPRWDMASRGSWLGLKPENTRGDMLRSVLEGVTFNLSICLDILRTQVEINEVLVIGGGAKGKVWRQIMADIFDAEIKVPKLLEEAGSMGAAVIAGIGAGLYDDFNAIDKFIQLTDSEMPNPTAVQAYKVYQENFEIYYNALKPAYELISKNNNVKEF